MSGPFARVASGAALANAIGGRMGTVLSFKADGRTRGDGPARGDCEIVIFPGVRIERQAEEPDPHLRPESTGRGNLDGTNGRRRPRKTS
jgi:hypothetical protein